MHTTRHGRGRAWVRGATTPRQRAGRGMPGIFERLERRMLLTMDLGAAAAAASRQIEWAGRAVETRADAWVVRSTVELGLAPVWRTSPLGEGFYALSTPGATVADVTAWAARTPGITAIEPDAIITGAAVPNDTSFSQLWGLNNTGQSRGVADADIDAPEAWSVTTGSRSVVVAVIDTGVDYSHPDLAANIWTNSREIAGDGLDNDGNGFVDDVRGWDFANRDADPMDDQGHGTHVAGTIGAVGNNGLGVAGVNWQVSIMPLKFLGADGSGTTSNAIAAINYTTRMRRDFGINVVATNNSWGGGGASTALRLAIEAGEQAGILCVAAAGNESSNNDVTPSYPANSTPGVISVAATDRTNALASFSNYGATSVDVAAPGVAILSTLPGGRYGSYSGTSMATPHVAGIVALLAAAEPTATAARIREAILTTTSPVVALAGKVASGGLVNAAAAVQSLRSVPTPEPEPVADLAADIVDVTPDPRTTAVDAIAIQFNRPVTGFDPADLALTRNGTAVSLAGAGLSSTDGLRWTLSGLAAATASAGAYTLTLSASSSGIVDVDGRGLTASATDAWSVVAPTLVDAGDTLATAASIGITQGDLRLAGAVGDGRYGRKDVDLYRVTLAAGQRLVIDVDARSLSGSSTLDSYLRVFDGRGRQLAANDDADGSLDSFLAFTAVTAGTYYVGLSGYRNAYYSPTRAGSGANGSTGVYQVAFSFGPQPSRGGTAPRVALLPAATTPMQRQAAFAVYGANWMAAVPAVRRR
ncbi:MAG: hypothetical protein RLZZ111_129 [Planctomycetota bacterium]